MGVSVATSCQASSPKGQSLEDDSGRSRRRRAAWREESDTTELAQQLLVASEQTRRGLEAELRKCALKLEQAEGLGRLEALGPWKGYRKCEGN